MIQKKRWALELPLRYNIYDLREKYWHESEIVFDFKEPLWWEEVDTGTSFSVCCIRKEADSQYPENYFLLQIRHISAENEDQALRSLENSITRICKALTFLMLQSNANIQGFQPRVYADYSSARLEPEASESEDEPTVTRIVDERGRVREIISMEIRNPMSFSVYMTLCQRMDTRMFQSYYDVPEDYRVKYLMDELYMAQGEEQLSSKLFHLISMIEFVEAEYKELSRAKEMLSKEDMRRICAILREATELEKEKKDRLIQYLSNQRAHMTDLGRSAKLFNIFCAMGIQEIAYHDVRKSVDLEYTEMITRLRNVYFHVSKKKMEKEAIQKLPNLVMELQILAVQIMNYAVRETQEIFLKK